MKKTSIIVLVILLIAMFFTNPTQEKHVEKYTASTSLSAQVGDFVSFAQGEYSNLFIFSYYKRGDSSSIGVLGMVLSL